MKVVQVYDPISACHCGQDCHEADPDVVNFGAMLAQLGAHGVRIERYNLGLHPLEFIQNVFVRNLLDEAGGSVLPIIFWDGEIHLKGRYPTREERPGWFRAAVTPVEAVS